MFIQISHNIIIFYMDLPEKLRSGPFPNRAGLSSSTEMDKGSDKSSAVELKPIAVDGQGPKHIPRSRRSMGVLASAG